MGRVLNRLEALQAELSQRAPHPLLGHGSLHASLISGGQELSSYPETCTVEIERRTLPNETIDAVEDEFDAILQDLGAKDRRFQGRQRTTLVRPPFSVPEDAPIVGLCAIKLHASSAARRQRLAHRSGWTLRFSRGRVFRP